MINLAAWSFSPVEPTTAAAAALEAGRVCRTAWAGKTEEVNGARG